MATMTKENIDIGLTRKQMDDVVSILQANLADESVLYTMSRNFHWNVTGPHFGALHELFERHYKELAETVDEIAERIRSLGSPAPGSMAEFLKSARLHEQKGEIRKDTAMLEILLQSHEAMIQQLRKDVDSTMDTHGDSGTSDFLTSLLRYHEKTAWMLRAHLESA